MLLVDVFNVVHAVPKAAPELGGISIDGLVPLINAGRFSGEPVWLVCDGTGGGRARWNDGAAHGNVRMMFAGPGNDADSLIERILDELERSGRLGGVVVVSSDRRVQAAAVGVRVRWMNSEQFVRLLVDDAAKAERDRQRGTGGRPSFATRESLDQEATAAWMREFGFEAESREKQAEPPTQDRKVTDSEAARNPRKGEQPPVIDADMLRELEEWADELDRDDESR